jgi:hypothetical protein
MNGMKASFFGLVRQTTRSYLVYPRRRNCEGSNMPNYTGRQRKLSDVEIIERYRQGLDAETVGIAAGCSGTTVLAIVRAAGETIRQRGKGSTGKRKRLALSDEEIIKRYQDGASAPEIAQVAGCTAEVIYRTLRNANVPRRVPYSHSRTRSRSP